MRYEGDHKLQQGGAVYGQVFKMVNEEYFGNGLEMPTITIQSTVGAYGHVTTSKVWKTDAGNASYELNIGADQLKTLLQH